MKKLKKSWWVPTLIATTIGTAVYLVMPSDPAGPGPAEAQNDVRAVAQSLQLAPDSPRALAAPAAELSPADAERLVVQKRQLRERVASATASNPPSPAGLAEVTGQGTQLVDGAEGRFHGTPSATQIGRNNTNTIGNGGAASTLAEPAAANNGVQVLASGNSRHYEISGNGGVTWTSTTFPAGPSDAPTVCCDNDVIHDKGRGVTFLSTLYLNSSGPPTNGVVRIFVFRNINTLTPNCSYTIDPAGTANNIVPDFPHLGLSNNHLYLTLNNLPAGAAQIRRFNIDNMADCVTAATNVVTLPSSVGQRIGTPASGAKEVQYFTWAENSTTIRIWSWPQSSTTLTSVTRTLSTSNFTNPDCRGGTLNNDFTDSLWSSIHGFNRRAAAGKGRLYVYWNVGPDASHTQGHVHSAIFSEVGLTLLAQTPMFISGNTACNGLPMIATNDRGDLGISTAVGGRAGGGGTAAQAFVAIADDFAGGIGFFPFLSLSASGTHNRTDQRYRDYFTVRPHNPCGGWWSATNYALSGGTGVANVNSRYVEFGRSRDNGCWNEWKNAVPALQ